jgi:hypothetical protein
LLIVDLRLGAEARVHEHAASPIADNGTIERQSTVTNQQSTTNQ